MERFRHELDYEIVHAMPLHLCLSIKKLARLSLMGLNENGRGVDTDFDGTASLFNAQTIPYRVLVVCSPMLSHTIDPAAWVACDLNVSIHQ